MARATTGSAGKVFDDTEGAHVPAPAGAIDTCMHENKTSERTNIKKEFIELTGRNPSTHWCFLDEHNIGLVKKALKNAHGGHVSKTGIEALLLWFVFEAEGRTVAMRAEFGEFDV